MSANFGVYIKVPDTQIPASPDELYELLQCLEKFTRTHLCEILGANEKQSSIEKLFFLARKKARAEGFVKRGSKHFQMECVTCGIPNGPKKHSYSVVRQL